MDKIKVQLLYSAFTTWLFLYTPCSWWCFAHLVKELGNTSTSHRGSLLHYYNVIILIKVTCFCTSVVQRKTYKCCYVCTYLPEVCICKLRVCYFFTNWEMKSMGSGKMIVEFFSAEMVLRVWRYRSCKALLESSMMSEASLRARAALNSPSAAITYSRWYTVSMGEGIDKQGELLTGVGGVTRIENQVGGVSRQEEK